jgi:hypothetical protein
MLVKFGLKRTALSSLLALSATTTSALLVHHYTTGVQDRAAATRILKALYARGMIVELPSEAVLPPDASR